MARCLRRTCCVHSPSSRASLDGKNRSLPKPFIVSGPEGGMRGGFLFVSLMPYSDSDRSSMQTCQIGRLHRIFGPEILSASNSTVRRVTRLLGYGVNHPLVVKQLIRCSRERSGPGSETDGHSVSWEKIRTRCAVESEVSCRDSCQYVRKYIFTVVSPHCSCRIYERV